MNRPGRLALPEVTLLCVDTRTPQLAVAAMRHCMAQIDFGAVLLLTAPQALATLPPDIPAIAVQIDSVDAYSRLLLTGLLPHIRTSHVLIVQWDGFVLDASQWSPAFLAHDYIGAPWHDMPPERSVGNGGFSLRSRRLLEALQQVRIDAPHPEDICICQHLRPELEARFGLRFAPPDLARRFAFERLPPAGPSFGFHGLFNMHHALPPAALSALLGELPDAMARGLDAHDLCARLIRLGRLADAHVLLDKRRRLGMRDRRTLRLALRLACARLKARLAPAKASPHA